MALEDFEKELAERQETERRQERRKEKESHREHDRRSDHKHHSHRSRRDRDEDHGERRSKRRKYEDEENSHRHRHKQHPKSDADEESGRHYENSEERPQLAELKRDSWMVAPSAIDIDYVQRRKKQPSPPKQSSLGADFELKIHEKELNRHLRDLHPGQPTVEDIDGSAAHETDYKFGDNGSQWRMTQLKAVYRQAKGSGRKVEDVALERYGTLKDFDDVREEEIELERRNTYGRDYVGKDKPSGELHTERRLAQGVKNTHSVLEEQVDRVVDGIAAPAPIGIKMDQTALNKLRAQLMKAQLRKDPALPQLQKTYDEAMAASANQDQAVVTLSAMDSRMLSSAPRNEVKSVQNKRGAERGRVEENEDMSIEDMVREERRTRGQNGGEGQRFAERIVKDGKFDNDLDYMDENANKLAQRVHKSDTNLRNIAIGEYQKLNKILENCPLCHHEDTNTPPIAPIVSLATRTYLSLPTEPELALMGAVIVPIQHKNNLLEADDDEWEEIRNFMKSLTRFYHDQGRDVIFYENAAHPHRKPHAALNVVPLPYSLGETAPAFFKEAFLTTEDEWSQHKKIIDTLARSKQGMGKLAFRRSLVKEMPYFHVWFEMDGGIGHVVEDANRWPKGDLFAREIIGGMLGLEPDVVKRQGKWHRGHDARVESFRKKWRRFDWTRILTEE